ncbi:DUF3418 domain-containing protein [Streptomyces thinghirensis]|nr:DUF3418 domain-containing protein [Streptomyces thinghirensis]
MNEKAGAVTKDDYPDSWRQGPLKFRVTYQFEPRRGRRRRDRPRSAPGAQPGHGRGLRLADPGPAGAGRHELIRSLPKPIRRNYVPAPNYAQAFLDRAVPLQEPLTVTMARELKRMVGVPFDAEDFDWSRVPDHLKITFPDRPTSGAASWPRTRIWRH